MSEEKDLNLESPILPEVQLTNDELLIDGIESVDDVIENPQELEEEVTLDLTFDEKKKYLRGMGKKLTDEEIDLLTDQEIEEIKEFAKLKERKAIYKFVHRKKSVTDEEVKNLTDEEVEELTAVAMAMSRHLSYNPKKNFGTKYKKKRQNRNKMAKASRRRNR